MENKQFKLCLEVLHRFRKAGLLNKLILVGSWCLYFYKEYFYGVYVVPLIRTRDIDFLVPLPPKMKNKADVPGILRDLGFVIEFVGPKGYLRLGHPDLIVEFLVPERGKGSNKPYPLPQIGMNAQPLRFLDFLGKNVIEISINGMRVKLPHPIAYALHKLIILGRRAKKEKAAKDRDQALMIFHHVLKHEKPIKIKEIFLTMPKKWQDKIFKTLKELDEEEILSLLST